MPRPKQQMSKYGASASAVTTASRLGKRKLRVRIVEKSESEDSGIEDVIEQTRSISLAQEHSGDVSASSAADASADEEPTYHELAGQSETVPKQRKKREITITDELREHMDDDGIRCQKCGVKTKKTSILLLNKFAVNQKASRDQH
jgi:hypothetical protein